MNAITQDLLIKLEMGKKKAIRLGKVMSPLKSEVKKTKVYHYIMDHKQTREGAALQEFRDHFCQKVLKSGRLRLLGLERVSFLCAKKTEKNAVVKTDANDITGKISF